MTKFPKEARLYARVHESTKEKLQKSGYNTAEAVEWFVHEYYSNNPKRKAKMKYDLLAHRLDNLKREECEIQVEIQTTEKQMDALVNDNPGLFEEDLMDQVTQPVVEEVKSKPKKSVNVKHQTAINRIRPTFENKREELWDYSLSDEENIEIFISLHQEMCLLAFNECCKDLGWYGFKEFLVEELL